MRQAKKLKRIAADIRRAEREGDLRALTNLKLDYARRLSFELGQHDEAISRYREVLDIYTTHKQNFEFDDWDFAYGYRFLGLVYQEKKDYNNAIKSFERGLDVIDKGERPKDECRAEKARILSNLGQAYSLCWSQDESSESAETEVDHQSQYVLDPDNGYLSMDDELFVFERNDALQQAEHYFRGLMEYIQECGHDLEFDENDGDLGDEVSCIVKVTRTRLNRYRNVKPFGNNFDLTEVLNLFDRILNICDEIRKDEFMYKKACVMCLLGHSYRAQAIDLFETIINLPESRIYFKRRSYEQLIVFTLRSGAFSRCRQIIRKSRGLLDEKYVSQRLNRIQEIEQIFLSNPSDGLAPICSEKGEYHAASDLYLEMLQNENDPETRIKLWLDKEAALRGWLESFHYVPESGPEDYDMGRDKPAILSEIRFAYLHRLDQLTLLPDNASNAKRCYDTMMGYGKFISDYNADEAIQVFESIIQSPNASSGHTSAASNAVIRLKSISGTQEQDSISLFRKSSERESPKLKATFQSPLVQVINISDEKIQSYRNADSDQETPHPDNGTLPPKGQAIRRKKQTLRKAIVEAHDTCDTSCSESSEEGRLMRACCIVSLAAVKNKRPGFNVNNPAKEDLVFSEADAARISNYSEKEIRNKLREEKAKLKRPAYLAFYNLELGIRLHDYGNLKDALPYYEQAAAFCPPGATHLTDFKNLFFNMGKVHRMLGHWECAVPKLKKAAELFDTGEHVLECADSFIELGHLHSDEAEKLEKDEYALAFRRCLGRVSFKYFEASRRRLLKAKGKCDEKRRLELLSHVLSNEAISWLVQENGEQAAKTIRHAISHCRQYDGLENWLCQSLNTSHDINKFLRRNEEARNNLRECLQQSNLKGGEQVLFFDFDNADIGKADGECFGCYYWNSMLSLAKMAAQMHKLGEAKRLVNELEEKSDCFHEKFRSMVAVTRDHVRRLGEMLAQRDELIIAVSNPQSSNLLENLRKLCKICEDAEDFEILIIFADKWSQSATDSSEKYNALNSLYLGYKELRRLKEAAAALHAMCSVQDVTDVDCRIKFLNLYKLALLYNLVEGRESANVSPVVSKMKERFKHIESEFKGSPGETFPFKAAMLDLEFLTCDQGELGRSDEQIVALHKEWKTTVQESATDSSEDSSSGESSHSCENGTQTQDMSRHLSTRESWTDSRNSKRSRQLRLSHRPGANSGRSRRSNHLIASSGVQPVESGGCRVSRSNDRLHKKRRTSNGSQKTRRISIDKERPLVFGLTQQRRPSFEQRTIPHAPLVYDADTVMTDYDCVDHLQGMLSDNDANDTVNNDPEYENVTDRSRTSASVVQPVLLDSASALVLIDHFQFLITCHVSNSFQWLIDEVAERFYDDQARRPIIKHFLLDGAIIGNSDLVLPLIRSHPDAKFVAVVSHYREVALSVYYQAMCEENQDEYSLNLDILDRLTAVSLQTIDISYIISLPNSIAPLIKIFPRQRHHLTELVFDCSGFNDACAVLLADVIADLSSLRKVSLAVTIVTTIGASALMRKCKSLQSFDIHAVDLSGFQPEIIDLFLQSNPRLDFADFSFCRLTQFPSLETGCCSIRSLNISGNCFADSAVLESWATVRLVGDR